MRKLFYTFLFITILGIVNGQSILNSQFKNKTEVISKSETGFVVRNQIGNLNFDEIKTEKGVFFSIDIDGYSYGNDIGKPKLPVNRNLIEIPFGAKITLEINQTQYKEYSLKDYGVSQLLIPVQPPAFKSQNQKRNFVIDQSEYSKDEFLSLPLVSIEYLGEMRGVRLARINVAPVQYNPVKGRIIVYHDIVVNVKFEGANLEFTKREKQRLYSPYFNSFETKLLNYIPNTNTKDSISKYPIKYVIVSDPMFQSALQPFIQWKTKKGFNVIEAYTNNPNVGNTTTSIKNYLQGLYNNATTADPAPTYVLFVGDVAQIPSFTGTTDNHKTDLYYCEYTGDFFPEVYYGRFSAQNLSQLLPQINKTIEYEQYTMPNKTFLNNIVMIAGIDANFGNSHANGQVNYATSTYFNSGNGYNCSSYLYPSSSNYAAEIRAKVSEGVGFVNYTAHGSATGWNDPSFTNSHVPSLQNQGRYPLMIGNCCLSNKFDVSECFGEALLRAENKGAVGYIGGSNNTLWDEDFWWACGVGTISANASYSTTSLGAYDRIMHTNGEPFSQWYVTQGQMINAGNLAVTQGSPSEYDYYWEIYHLMGDPSLMPYFKVPQAIQANYSPILPLGVGSLVVNTDPYAYVALSLNGVLLGAALADSSGNAVLSFNPIQNQSTLDIVITRQNRQPFFGTIQAISPSGPYLILNNYQINDNAGNNNGLADYGEIIKLNAELKNVGNNIGNGIIAKLSSNSQYITITDSVENFGNISSGLIKSINNAFTFQVAQLLPDQTLASFELKITDNTNNSWTYNFNIVLNAPKIQIGNIVINDITGNNNGRLDAGETVSFKITVKNTGNSDASNVITTISSLNNFLILNNTSVNIGNLQKNSTYDCDFQISANSNVQVGMPFTVNINTGNGVYNDDKIYTGMIGSLIEDFESGFFNKFNWDTTSPKPWTITSVDTYEGYFCAKSGVIPDNDSSVIFLNINVLADDSISFYRKVSSENNWDFLNFYIDNVRMGRWSGQKAWARVSFPISAGNHTLKWIYAKDETTYGGSDCAWIDLISFPPIQTILSSDGKLNNDFAELFIFPNPCKNSFNISLNNTCLKENESLQVSLFNSAGQLVYSLINKNSESNLNLKVDVSNWSKGIYYLSINTKNQVLTKKIIVTE